MGTHRERGTKEGEGEEGEEGLLGGIEEGGRLVSETGGWRSRSDTERYE